MQIRNLNEPPAAACADEVFERLAAGSGFELERIVSTGQATPRGQWMDQDRDEWVMLASGQATLRFEGAPPFEMHPGDYIMIPAHCRHRIESTDAAVQTVWLALHFEP